MKKYATTLLAAMLGLSMLGLPACGGSNEGSASGGAAEESAAEKETPAEPEVDESEKFVGSWTLAAIESQGLTIVGDFTMFMEEDENMVIVLDKGGNGNMSFGDDSIDVSWELKSDDVVTLSVANDSDEADESETVDAIVAQETLDLTYEDGELVMEIDDEDFSGVMTFSADGTTKRYPELAPSAFMDLTSADGLAGAYGLSGVNVQGVTMYGEPEALAEITGESTDTSMTLNEDGTAVLLGYDVTWEVGDDGGKIVLDESHVIPMSAIGTGLVLDFSELYGSSMYMFYTL